MDIFEELGIQRYINAQDTFTKYGASCMSEASLRAMYEISRSWVDLDEVQRKAGDAVAKLTHNEAAYLTNGAAGGLMVCAASALALDSEEAFEALPDTGARCEIVVQRAQHNSYDSCLRTAGAKLVWTGSETKAPGEEEFASAITERTAAVAYFIYHGRAASLPLETVVRIAHAKGVPVIVDAAAQNPPAENLWKYTVEVGADMAIFSGGKTLRGPQDSGLVVGKREWIERCRRWGPPRDGVCRGCKTSREAMAGLYVAVRDYLAQDEEAAHARRAALCELWEETARACGCTQVRRSEEGPVGQKLWRSFAKPARGSAAQAAEKMRRAGVYIGTTDDGSEFIFNPLLLNEDEAKRVCEATREALKQTEG